MPRRYVWLQNRLCDQRKAAISVLDHGVLYGDGLYETLRVENGSALFWSAHIARMRESAERLGLKIPWTLGFFQKAIRAVLRANQLTSATVRLTVTRGAGPLGLSPSQCRKPVLIIQVHPPRNIQRLQQAGVMLVLATTQRNAIQAQDPRIKALSALNGVLARQEADRAQAFDAVMVNAQRHITETTVANVFWVKRNILYTPALECGLLAGITRGAILTVARMAAIPVRQGRYRPAKLTHADEAFLCNSTALLPVVALKVGTKVFSIGQGCPGPLTRILHAHYRKYVKQEAKLL